MSEPFRATEAGVPAGIGGQFTLSGGGAVAGWVGALIFWCVLAAPMGAQQFVLWDQYTINGPFSVTMSMRGIPTVQGMDVKFEGYVGYNPGTGNEFVRHQSEAIGTTLPSPPSLAGSLTFRDPAFPEGDSSSRSFRLEVEDDIEYPDEDALEDLEDYCCQNNAEGSEDNLISTGASIFGNSSSRVELDEDGTPTFVLVENGRYSPFFKYIGRTTACPNRGLEIAVLTSFPGDGVEVQSTCNGGSEAAEGGAFTSVTTLSACRGVASSYHHGAARAPGEDDIYVACATTSNTLRLTRVDLNSSGGLEASNFVDVDTGLAATSGAFVYQSVAACAFGPTFGGHTAVGLLSPRTDTGATDVFFRIFDNATGLQVGGTDTSLAGARANHPAWSCRTNIAGNQRRATFVFNGPGAVIDTTETHVWQLAGTPAAPQALHRSKTDSRMTLWADFPNFDLGYGPESGLKPGMWPVGELSTALANSPEGIPGVRYGGIDVPVFFDSFESGDLSFWSSATGTEDRVVVRVESTASEATRPLIAQMLDWLSALGAGL